MCVVGHDLISLVNIKICQAIQVISLFYATISIVWVTGSTDIFKQLKNVCVFVETI